MSTSKSKSVLLSIKPCYVERIFNGTKHYEFRKRIFNSEVQKVVVYSSRPVARVVGEFVIANIYSGTPVDIWQRCKEFSGINEADYFDYFKNKQCAYAIEVSQPRLYAEVLPIMSFCKRPPQSFCYLR